MMPRRWRRRWPWDVRLGYATAGCFALWVALSVAAGPALIVMLSACLVVPLTAVVAGGFILGARRRARALPLALTAGCVVAAGAAPPDLPVDLHPIARVFAAGPPAAVNEWDQGLLREQQGTRETWRVRPEELPAGIRDHLCGRVSVGGTIWSELPRVRIELGAGSTTSASESQESRASHTPRTRPGV
jgi:hypothetical protein